MGKSFELLGMAAFNIFIAIILSATILAKPEAARVASLTESNVEHFITEVAQVSGGLRKDMDPYSVTDYFMTHIAEDGNFSSTIQYSMPEVPHGEGRTIEMDKMNFISHVLQSMKGMDKHETAVTIDYIKIADNGRRADVTTTNYERGVMPVADEAGEAKMIPVTGTSYCEQTIVLSARNVIQMQKAACSTNIDFSDAY